MTSANLAKVCVWVSLFHLCQLDASFFFKSGQDILHMHQAKQICLLVLGLATVCEMLTAQLQLCSCRAFTLAGLACWFNVRNERERVSISLVLHPEVT